MQWSALDHIPADAFVDGFPYNAANFDFVHGNAVEYDLDGNLLISIRTANAVYKIDHTTGSVIWRLGGDYNEFNFLNDPGFIAQHDIRRLPNGNITVFDNQWGTTAGSRCLEYELDTANSTALLVSEYDYDWPLNCYSLGSFRKLENGYSVIGWGNTRRPEPSVTLIDSNQNIATDIFFSDTVVTYRAFFQEFELSMTQPEIICSNDGTTLTLSAPAGYNNYLWSSGESSQTITVADTGVYILWVDQGIGMLGSKPYHIEDLATHCISAGLNEYHSELPKSGHLIGYFDMLGRKITRIPIGTCYFEVYSDGKSFRRIRWEE